MKNNLFDLAVKFVPGCYAALLLAGIIRYKEQGMNGLLVGAIVFGAAASLVAIFYAEGWHVRKRLRP